MDSGIYEIVNTVTGKRYVGSAVNLAERWSGHVSTANKRKHKNQKLQRAWNKYGEQAFTFSVLLHCAPEDLLMYEQLVIDVYDVVKTGYNICAIAGSSLGVKHGPEYCAKISESKRGTKASAETKAKMSAAGKGNQRALGLKHSAETKAKYSAQRLGNKINLGRKQTPEHIAKVVARTTGKKRAPRAPEWSAKIGAGNSGKKQSPEHLAKRFSPEARAKMSAAAKARKKREQAARAELLPGYNPEVALLTVCVNDEHETV